MKKKKLVAWLKDELKYYQHPGPYQDPDYYVRCDAKADTLEEVLDQVDPEWRSK